MLSPLSHKDALKQEQQKIAAELLRKRLKAELRPDISTDGLHQIQLNDVLLNSDHGSFGSEVIDLARNKRGEMPSQGIRRVSTKWDKENPFSSLRSTMTKTEEELETRGHQGFQRSHDGSFGADENDKPGKGTIGVALARAPLSRTRWPKSFSSSWLHADTHAHPYRYHQPLRTSWAGRSASAPLVGRSLRVVLVPESLGGSIESSSDDSMPVVVARAECELAHPRPSRSSETKMMKVLVTDGENQISQESEGVGSLASMASYHTARQ